MTQVLDLSFTVQTLYALQLGAWSAVSWPRWQREVVATARYFFDIMGEVRRAVRLLGHHAPAR